MRAVAFAVLLVLGACGFTGTGDVIRQGVAAKGAQAADEGLKNAEWYVCQAASIGSIKRKYGVSRERAVAYNAFCPETSGSEIVSGPVQ